jgi:hypothetical protein
MRTTYIYELSKNGVPFYIGKTIDPTSRIMDHKKSRGQSITLTLIDEINGDVNKWKPLESYWIEQYRQWGFILENKNKGGGGKAPIYTTEELHQSKSKCQKKYNQQNKETIQNWQKQYYNSHKNLYSKYYQDNKEIRIEYHKKRYQSKKTNLTKL